MKKFILLSLFAIGLMVSLPLMSSGSTSPPPDQVNFVADLQQDVQSYEVQAIAIDYPFAFEFTAIRPPGLCTAENVVQKAPDFEMFYRLNYRTCLSCKFVNSNNKIFLLNKAPDGQIRIRDDTSV